MNLKVLKAYRVMSDLTQNDMAKLLGISVVAYKNKEWGRAHFTLPESKKIADLFKRPIEQIFYSDEINIKCEDK